MNERIKKHRDEFHGQGFTILKSLHLQETINSALTSAKNASTKLSFGETKVELDFQQIKNEKALLKLIDSNFLTSIICEILSFNIYINYMGLTFNPKQSLTKKPMKYHQDNGLMYKDISTPAPLLSVKVAHYLTSTQADNSGIFNIFPNSSTIKGYPIEDKRKDVSEAIELRVEAGDVLIFDPRCWHCRKPNLTDTTRIVLFTDYGFRWLEEKCNFAVSSEDLDTMSELQKALLVMPEENWRRFAPKKEHLFLKTLLGDICEYY